MHYVVYGRESNLVVSALVRGLRSAEHKVTVQRAELFRPNEAIQNADRVIVSGLRGKYTEVKEHYKGTGVPVIVREAPHFRDADRGEADGPPPMRYQRLSLDQHAWLPPFECPQDRFDRLGLAVTANRPTGKMLLVCGQTDLDTQHGKTAAELAAWLATALPAVQAATGLDPAWRPHPRALDAPKPSSGMRTQNPQLVPLAEALQNAGAVLTYNSTAGLVAIRRNIPVYSGGAATYSSVSHLIRGNQVLPPASKGTEARKALLARVAYTQWTHDEIEAGAWVSTIERSLGGEAAVAQAIDRHLPENRGEPHKPEPAQPAMGLDQAVAVLAQRYTVPFSLKETLADLRGLGVVAKRPAVRSELDVLVEAGVLEVADPGGRGRPRRWERQVPR